MLQVKGDSFLLCFLLISTIVFNVFFRHVNSGWRKKTAAVAGPVLLPLQSSFRDDDVVLWSGCW